MRIVAKSLSVSFSRSRRAGSAGSSSSLIASMSVGDNEKNATSDEDMKPERMRSKPLMSSATHAEKAISGLMIWFSVSKLCLISSLPLVYVPHYIAHGAGLRAHGAGSHSVGSPP